VTRSLPKEGLLPGRVVLFRETNISGKAGEIYRIENEQGKLQKIGEFDLKLSDDELLKKYAEGCD
jgi:hypothetical protein